jgi:hypothetical protein
VDQAQFVEDGVPIVIAVDEQAVKGRSRAQKLGGCERVEAVHAQDRHAAIRTIFFRKVFVETGIDNGVRGKGQLEEFVGGLAVAGAYFADRFPAAPAKRRCDKAVDESLQIRSSGVLPRC